jgi:hypothetical protein
MIDINAQKNTTNNVQMLDEILSMSVTHFDNNRYHDGLNLASGYLSYLRGQFTANVMELTTSLSTFWSQRQRAWGR